ncbi:MAG: SLBB domain-containing protein, partial [Bacteroidaceae bacterium]|nr:SLBB domain-containing protein [Bacteroidaceae bacterium]
MKKYFLFALFALSVSASFAQGSMSDDKIIQFVQREQQAGTSQAQIVTKLMQRGVTVEQIRRLRKKYNQEKNKSSLGASDLTGRTEADGNRLRKAAAKDEKKQQASNYMIKSGSDYIVNDDKRNFELMQREFSYMFPDSLDNFVPFDEGKNKKKIFGRDIFNNKNLSFEPNMNIATPQNYRLGPGDVVFIDIWGASQKTIQETVSPEGTIVVENVGPVAVSGLTVAEANARVRSKVGARYSSSNIKLTVGQTRTIQVQVMGEVVTPGTYTISAFASVFHALYQAGGVNDIGTLRAIKVYRNGRLVSTVDVYDYILNGKLSGNIRLAENDVIVVGSYDCLVNIVGKVKRPMYYEMKKNESLETLLGYAGGFTGDAFTGSVRLIRKSGREYSIHTIEEFERSTFKLTDGDSVTVDSVIPRYSNLTEVRGAVFRPGMYQVGGTIKTIRELIEHAGGVKEDAFVAHAVMHRRKKDRTLEAISVDVEGILSGKVADVPLQNEDVLFIPNKNEMQEQKTLTIYGEVQFP